jgi:TetR/AcrR family transcriptional regulator, transcriptional repressor for nem operon
MQSATSQCESVQSHLPIHKDLSFLDFRPNPTPSHSASRHPTLPSVFATRRPGGSNPLSSTKFLYTIPFCHIGGALVDLRVSRFKKLLQELDKAGSPAERLCGFVQIKINNREGLARSGCPVGTFCSELHKHGGPVARKSTQLFALALAWMESQFKALGQGDNSRALAVHLLSATQGVSVLAHTFHDPDMITIEAARLKQWIRAFETQDGVS